MNNKDISPVLILGSERSGTNLLRALLSTHSQIASPPPAGFIEILGGIQSRYFPVGCPPYLNELIADVILHTKTHHNPWDIELNPDVIKARLNELTLWDIFRVVNEIYAEKFECRCWCSKEPGLFRYINELAECLPNAKFVYLVRDGRDVAASMLKGHLHEFHVYFAAQTWASTQRICLKAINDPDVSERIYLLKYEDLIDDTKGAMQDLMQFIGFEFEEMQLEYHRDEKVLKHSSKSRLWGNLAQPINKKNKGSYKSALGMKNVEIFESVAWEEMQALGYETDTSHNRTFTGIDIRIFQAIRTLRKLFWSMDPGTEARRSRARFKVLHQIMNKKM